jgi:hypothetical protein
MLPIDTQADRGAHAKDQTRAGAARQVQRVQPVESRTRVQNMPQVPEASPVTHASAAMRTLNVFINARADRGCGRPLYHFDIINDDDSAITNTAMLTLLVAFVVIEFTGDVLKTEEKPA